MADGCRALLVTPTGDAPQALRLDGDGASADVNCVSLYVQNDATLDVSPVYLTPAEWGTVAISGIEVIPSTTYSVRADCGSPGDPQLSMPAEATTWAWGDVEYPPDGNVNFRDITQVVRAFQGEFAEVTLERADLHPCEPNRLVNFGDINWDVQAFQGGLLSDLCAAPCP